MSKSVRVTSCHPDRKHYSKGLCRPCYERQPAKRESYLKRVYGLTLNQYDEMLMAQNGLCAICGGKERNDELLAIDHNHVTGEVRGLLCRLCNASLGGFGDDPNILAKAITYLLKRQHG